VTGEDSYSDFTPRLGRARFPLDHPFGESCPPFCKPPFKTLSPIPNGSSSSRVKRNEKGEPSLPELSLQRLVQTDILMIVMTLGITLKSGISF